MVMHGFFVEYGFLVLVFVALFCGIITYRGREFSWPAFGVLIAVNWAILFFQNREEANLIFAWDFLANWTVVIGVMAQIFMGLWFSTHPPRCPKCGYSLHLRPPPSR